MNTKENELVCKYVKNIGKAKNFLIIPTFWVRKNGCKVSMEIYADNTIVLKPIKE
jgi:hypothetical protein